MIAILQITEYLHFLNHIRLIHRLLRFLFGLVPVMGTEPVPAGVSWQNTIENGAHCEKRRQLALVSG